MLASPEALKRLPYLSQNRSVRTDRMAPLVSDLVADSPVWLPFNLSICPQSGDRLERSNGRKVLRVAFECAYS